jgi:glutamate racemase
MIGIFDSGIGGLTVVRELLRQAPASSFVYLGDTARTPYGNKGAETVARYSLEDSEFLLAKGAKSIVIACNTASALGAVALRNKYPNTPIIDVIEPAIEEALHVTRGRIGVIGTRSTINSGIYETLLRLRSLKIVNWKLEIFSVPCPLFVPLVEEGWLDDAETKRIVRRYLSPLRLAKVDTVILGCTHYPLLAPLIQRYVGNRVNLVDSGAAAVSRIIKSVDHEKASLTISQTYYFTDQSSRSKEIATRWLGRPLNIELARLSDSPSVR